MQEGDDPRWKLTAEAVRTWLPLVISVCAISLTIFQAWSARRHTRLSVQPRLDWTVQAASDGSVTYSLTNDGFGPAILRALDLRLDGAVVGSDGTATCAEIDRRLGREGDAWDTGCFDMEGEFVLPAGTSMVIYESRRAANAAAAPAPAPAPQEYLRLTPAGSYCSFYDECWPLD